MTYATVDSAVVDRIGYDAATELLSVTLKGGNAYEVQPCSAQDYAAFMSSPSKGVHWYTRLCGHARAAATGYPVKLREPAASAIARGTINTFAEDDGCCGKAISKAALAGVLESVTSWPCPKCGTDWTPTAIGETVKHWTPQPFIALIGGRR